MVPLGRKVVTPNPPLSAVGGAQRGVRGHNFSTQWYHCFGFGPSRSPFLVLGGAQRRVGVTTFRPNGTTVLVLAPPGAHFWFWEALKGGLGSQLFGQWNQWMRSFGFGPSQSLSQGSLSELTPLSEFSPLSNIQNFMPQKSVEFHL